MENKTTVEKTTIERNRYVIGPGGVRMTYDEWLDWRMSDKN